MKVLCCCRIRNDSSVVLLTQLILRPRTKRRRQLRKTKPIFWAKPKQMEHLHWHMNDWTAFFPFSIISYLGHFKNSSTLQFARDYFILSVPTKQSIRTRNRNDSSVVLLTQLILRPMTKCRRQLRRNHTNFWVIVHFLSDMYVNDVLIDHII